MVRKDPARPARAGAGSLGQIIFDSRFPSPTDSIPSSQLTRGQWAVPARCRLAPSPVRSNSWRSAASICAGGSEWLTDRIPLTTRLKRKAAPRGACCALRVRARPAAALAASGLPPGRRLRCCWACSLWVSGRKFGLIRRRHVLNALAATAWARLGARPAPAPWPWASGSRPKERSRPRRRARLCKAPKIVRVCAPPRRPPIWRAPTPTPTCASFELRARDVTAALRGGSGDALSNDASQGLTASRGNALARAELRTPMSDGTNSIVSGAQSPSFETSPHRAAELSGE